LRRYAMPDTPASPVILGACRGSIVQAHANINPSRFPAFAENDEGGSIGGCGLPAFVGSGGGSALVCGQLRRYAMPHTPSSSTCPVSLGACRGSSVQAYANINPSRFPAFAENDEGGSIGGCGFPAFAENDEGRSIGAVDSRLSPRMTGVGVWGGIPGFRR